MCMYPIAHVRRSVFCPHKSQRGSEKNNLQQSFDRIHALGSCEFQGLIKLFWNSWDEGDPVIQ